MINKGGKVISVIIPVYNAELYVRQCIDSVVNQSYSDWEMILVDDGSTDKSGEICDEYSKNDNRIKSFHRINGGTLVATQYGVSQAKGKYIAFIDADDWIDSEMFSELIARMEENGCDVITSGIRRYDISGQVQNYWIDNYQEDIYKSKLEMKSLLHSLILSKDMQLGVIGGIMDNKVCKIFKQELVKKTFDIMASSIKQLCVDEDFVFCTIYFLQCRSVIITHRIYYNYRYNEKSKTNTFHEDYLSEKNEVWKLLKTVIKGNVCENELMEQLKKRIFYSVCNGMKSYMGIDSVPTYLFPQIELLKDKKIVLFGAGKVGCDYMKQFEKKDIDVVAWVDNKSCTDEVLSPMEIKKKSFDYIVCGVLNEMSANNIKKQLKDMGIKEEQIIWQLPRNWLLEMVFD